MAEKALDPVVSIVSRVEPPPGPPWDLPLADAPFVFFDLEMTGLDPARDELIEVAMVRTECGRVTARLETLVHSAVATNPASAAVHGITPAALVGAPDPVEIAPRMHAMLSGAIPVAHGTALDLAFLDALFAKHGLGPDVIAFVLDTVTLARRCFAAPRYSLGALSHTLGLPAQHWHRAGDDVRGVMALFPRLVDELRATTPRDLWQVRIGQTGTIVVRDTVAAAITTALRTRTRIALWVRAHGSKAREVRGRVLAWEHPHALIATGADERGAMVVRADRVVRVGT